MSGDPDKSHCDRNLVGLKKGVHTYLVIYAEGRGPEAIAHLGKWAARPKLSFNWHDAMVVAQRIRSHEADKPGGAALPPDQSEER